MDSDFRRRVKVADLIKIGVLAIDDGYRVRNVELGPEGIPFVRGGDIGENGTIETLVEDHILPQFADRVQKKIARSRDVAFISKGTVGRVGILRDGQPNVVFSPQVCFWRSLNEQSLDPSFLYYLLQSREFRANLDAVKTQGSMVADYVSMSDQKSFLLTIPSINSQKFIAHILGTLDNKIELNRRMNETLESMARALFKSWFVDFDPVIDNALAAGNAIPEPLAARAATRRALGPKRKPLPENIQKLFPATFTLDEEMGWIPEGWVMARFAELCTRIQNGGTPRRDNSDYWEDGTIPWLTSGEVRQSIIEYVENAITTQGLENSSAKWLPASATVVAMYGATAGQVAFLSCPTTTNQAVCGLEAHEGFALFNYHFLSSNEKTLAHQARGSAQQNINKGIIEQLRVCRPPADLAKEFEKVAEQHFAKRVRCLGECRTLAQLRDTLLPKLLSGELRIPDAEKLVAGSV